MKQCGIGERRDKQIDGAEQSPGIDPSKHSPLISDKGSKTAQSRKDRPFNKWCQNNWTSIYKKINLHTDFTSFIKINAIWITDLSAKLKTTKLLDNIVENLDNLGIGDGFLAQHQIHDP